MINDKIANLHKAFEYDSDDVPTSLKTSMSTRVLTWSDYALQPQQTPTLVSTTETQKVYQYGPTRFRKVPIPYTITGDTFYSEAALTTLLASRA